MAVELVREVTARIWRCTACSGEFSTRTKFPVPDGCPFCHRRNELITAADPVVKAKPKEEQTPA